MLNLDFTLYNISTTSEFFFFFVLVDIRKRISPRDTSLLIHSWAYVKE